MEIILAKNAGFCYGVKRAVQIAEEAAETCENCVTIGPIIHNASVVAALREKGVRDVSDFSEISENTTAIIRSHGIGKSQYDALNATGANIIDATCPDVAKIHETVRKEAAEGRTIIIIGESNHPEVIAIAGWCENAHIFENPEELDTWFKNTPEASSLNVSVVSQTTGTSSNYERCVKIIKKQCTNPKVFDTICRVTSKRQEEAAALAKKCDAMIVIGGKNSANSKKLASICEENCKRVFFTQNSDELDVSEFRDINLLGITAGASTPAWIIKEVYQKMSDEIKDLELTESENPMEGAASEEESFEEMLEKSIKTLHTGEKVIGVVANITPTEITVDLGTKQSGYIPVAELSADPDAKVEDIVKIGDEIETYVMRVNDVEGMVMLSKRRLDSVKVWDDIIAAKDDKTVVEGIVTEDNKGGIVVSVKGVRVFVPASQSGLPKDADMASLIKSKVRLRITEVNQSRRRVVGSIRAVSYEERKAKADAIWNEIEVDKRYSGVVKSLTSYGAFVDIGGIDGMVHVSELSWSRIQQPSDVLKVGDAIEVYVISFDKENRKISLGYKDKSGNPWVKFTEAYNVGDTANVKIVKLMPFGAFAEVLPGVDGLIHISQIADRRINKPEEVLEVGQQVDVKIVEIDNEKQKISLSIRALIAPETAPAAEINDADAAEADEADAVVYDTDAPPAEEVIAEITEENE